jgi:serine protease Do
MGSSVSQKSGAPTHDQISSIMKGVVQIVALRQGFLGGMSPAWTGSGTVVHPSGIILTNCHVANPRAMGMPAPPADRLGIAITERSDETPVLTYFAEIVVQAPQVDLAVLRIVTRVDGQKVTGLNLPYVPIGDSDALDLGDTLSIFGYPGIGGDTVTYTSGSVAGFTQQKEINVRRAWIKTDATIAGGNSGGTAVNSNGQLVGVPTQAAAGTGITPVDARPVVDTNQDGRIDQRDTPMAVGGFINGLRPVNLAAALLQKAGVSMSQAERVSIPMMPAPKPSSSIGPVPMGQPIFSTLLFSRSVSQDGRPINPAVILPSGGKELYATFDYAGMQNGIAWGQVWAVNGKKIGSQEEKWDKGSRGRRTLSLTRPQSLPDGLYHLILTVGKQVLAEGEVTVGKRTEDTDTEISGQIIDAASRRGIPDALIIALRPNVQVQSFLQQQKKDMAATSTRTDANGRFTFPQQLPKGQAYGLIVVARGYRDLAIESALRLTAKAPEQAQLGAIELQRG